jgi:hypothetical protein
MTDLTDRQPALDAAASALYQHIIIPGIDLLASLGGPLRSAAADRLLLAISGQEADFAARVQRSRASNGDWFAGPARGLWQFERGGGVRGVLAHPRTVRLANRLCLARQVTARAADVHVALAKDDLLACGFARLLLYSDPLPLPDDRAGGWACYMHNWRPGKPGYERWPRSWRAALSVIPREQP